jgi:3-oxoacyl-[acyl-carrier protein] reductase
MDDLSGKVALVTGASRGIGRAIALELARAGADIVVHYRTRVEQAREVEAAVRSFGREARLVQAETHSPRNAVRLAKEAGQVDILINHVGIARPLPFHEVAETEWRELIFENANCSRWLIRVLLPGMRTRNWGRIVNLSSMAAAVGSG